MIRSKTTTAGGNGDSVASKTLTNLGSLRWRHYWPLLKTVEIAEATGPMTPIQGRTVLVLADMENLALSARDLGYKLSRGALATKLRIAAKWCSLHAFFSRDPGDEAAVRYFASRGWITHPYDIRVCRTCRGTQRFANSDNWLLFWSGALRSDSDAEVVVVATGDGALACDLARAISKLSKPKKVATLSLAGSTSKRLDAEQNGDIEANIEIGLDCLLPIGANGSNGS